MRFPGEDDESLTVYKFGYVAWNNLSVFQAGSRGDPSAPAVIRLEPFPAGQSHTRHVDFISAATRGVGLSSRAPIFWRMARPEELMR